MDTRRGVSVSVYERLKILNIQIPEVALPVAAFVPFVRTGNLLFVSGHIAKKEGKPWAGQLGAGIITEEGKVATRWIAVERLATLQAAVRDLNKIRRIVKLMVLVNSAPGFPEQHVVANGASELFGGIFLSQGAHARSAFGVAQIPFGSCVEIELVAEVI
jgi:enamine deaminase RidA (YjgF/YER057c/UK114 family)